MRRDNPPAVTERISNVLPTTAAPEMSLLKQNAFVDTRWRRCNRITCCKKQETNIFLNGKGKCNLHYKEPTLLSFLQLNKNTTKLVELTRVLNKSFRFFLLEKTCIEVKLYNQWKA